MKRWTQLNLLSDQNETHVSLLSIRRIKLSSSSRAFNCHIGYIHRTYIANLVFFCYEIYVDRYLKKKMICTDIDVLSKTKWNITDFRNEHSSFSLLQICLCTSNMVSNKRMLVNICSQILLDSFNLICFGFFNSGKKIWKEFVGFEKLYLRRLVLI